jgi:hypothetical protein
MTHVPVSIAILLARNTGTWEDFGVLWNWAKEQEWWSDFLLHNHDVVERPNPYFMQRLIDPIVFPRTVMEWVKERI